MKKTHPLAAQSHARIDLFTRGRQATIIRDSFILLRHAVQQLPRGENVLYINTLTGADAVIEVAEKLSARYNRDIHTFSGPSHMVMERLQFLGQTIAVKKIKLVILNAFEFAAIYSRQRNRLATWLREMRDEHGIRIVVYSTQPAQQTGPHGVLSSLAERVQEVGAWQYDMDETLRVQESPLAAAKEFSEMLDNDPNDESPETYWVDRSEVLKFSSMAKNVSRSSLIYNDLDAVSTQDEQNYADENITSEGVHVEEEDLQYA
jgi:hypothetical protein